MCLRKPGQYGGNMIYTLGKASEFWDRWKGATLGQQREWRVLIRAATDAVRSTQVHMIGIN